MNRMHSRPALSAAYVAIRELIAILDGPSPFPKGNRMPVIGSMALTFTDRGRPKRPFAVNAWNPFDASALHRAFTLSLGLKGIFALLEIMAGIATCGVDRHLLINLVLAVFRDELNADPHDLIANTFLQAAQGFSVGTQLFVSFYLLANGLTKAVLIAGLARGTTRPPLRSSPPSWSTSSIGTGLPTRRGSYCSRCWTSS